MNFLNFLDHVNLLILGTVILAVLVICLVMYFTSHSVKPKEGDVEPKDGKKRVPHEINRTPPWGGPLSRYFTVRGYFSVGDLTLIFLRGLELLKARLDTVHYKYYLPWYLMIGTSGSGKSNLMGRSELVLPLGEPDFGIKEENPGLKWWFLNRGIVLDVRGDYFVEEEGTHANEKGWRTIISLLGRYRSNRPIDGIILTIPATEFYGPEKMSLEEISDRARYISQKLSTTQNHLGLRLPVYVVITKTDTVPGFKNLCHTIPAENRQNILGWNCPYHPSIAYDKSWVAEAFSYIHHQLNKLKYEILAAGPSADERDGVFIFPSELMNIERAVSIYLNQLFKVTSYDESLALRGIYFTGDSGQTLDPSVLFDAANDEDINDRRDAFAHLNIGDLDTSLKQEADLTTIYFFNDVLNKKIFKEIGLAQPIHQRLISMNRHIMMAKIGMIGFVGIGTYGLIKTYNHLEENRDYLLPILGKTNTILSQIPETRLDPTRFSTQMLDEQARQLLEMMSNIHKVSFTSLYFPASWFSGLNAHLKQTLKISFDQIIVRTIYMDLLLKSRDLLTVNIKSLEASEAPNSFEALLIPAKMSEFELLKGYVQRFIDLSHHIDLYNRLGDNPDPTALEDLVAYTKQIELPAEFLENYTHFQSVFRSIPYAQIDLAPYQVTARDNLKKLYVHFIDHLLNPAQPNSIIGRMNFIVREYGHRTGYEFPSLTPLRNMSHDLNKTIPEMGSPGKTWIDNSYFDAGPQFAELMNEISQFKYFGPEMVQYFAALTHDSFLKFQDKLMELNATFAPRRTGAPVKKHYPSDGIFSLQLSLDQLFREKFMAVPSGETFVTDIPDTHVVYWDPVFIDMAIADIKSYETYLHKNFEAVPVAIRGTIKEIARETLIANVVSLLGQAQTIVPRPKALSNIITAEETLRDKIADVKAISPKFIKLLETMNQSEVGTSYVSLRSLLGVLTTRLLEQVDSILESYGLYIVKDGNFNWWDGYSSPMLEGFNVRDLGELIQYFDRERGLVGRLAQNYADFLINFLTNPVMRDYNGRDDLINKWKKIITDIQGYDKKAPGNSIFALEQNIQKDLIDTDLKICFLEIPLSEIKRGSGDYFTNRKMQLRRSLRSRCEVLRRQKSIESYNELSKFFNENLKGKFPFSSHISPDDPEAEANDIRAFFKMYKAMGDKPTEIYDQVYQLGADAEDTFAFLSSMEKIKGFFKEFLKSPLAGEVPTFTFEADARINRDAEVRANLISQWILKPDATTELLKNDMIQQGKWSYGNDIILNLVWAPQSRIQPHLDTSQANMQVTKNVAQFSYTGRWALLRMITQQQAPRSDYNMINEPTPYILKYQIPNGPTEKTITFMRITLLAPPKGNAPAQPMQVPVFPVAAPEVPETILAKAQLPVLTTGEQLPVDISVEATETSESEEEEGGSEGGKKKAA